MKKEEKHEKDSEEKQKDTKGKHIASLTYVELIPYSELQKGDPHAPSDKSDFDIEDLTLAHYSKLFEYPLADVYVKSITNLEDILQVNKEFPLSDDIKVSLMKKMQFYRITLAASFERPLDVRIDWGKLSISTNMPESMIHSVYPDRIDEITKANKKFGLDTSLKLQGFGVELEPEISYIDERSYNIIHP